MSFLRIAFSGTGVSLTPALIIFQEELSAYRSLYPKSFYSKLKKFHFKDVLQIIQIAKDAKRSLLKIKAVVDKFSGICRCHGL